MNNVSVLTDIFEESIRKVYVGQSHSFNAPCTNNHYFLTHFKLFLALILSNVNHSVDVVIHNIVAVVVLTNSHVITWDDLLLFMSKPYFEITTYWFNQYFQKVIIWCFPAIFMSMVSAEFLCTLVIGTPS